MDQQPDRVPALPRLVQIEPVGQCTLRCRPMRDFSDGDMLGEADRVHTAGVFAVARARADALGVPLRLPRLGPRAPFGPDVPGRGLAEPPAVCAGCAVYRGTF